MYKELIGRVFSQSDGLAIWVVSARHEADMILISPVSGSLNSS